MPELSYSIQIVSKLTDISIYTLRTWEKRYKFVVPKRHANGRREYSESDVETLWLLGDLVKLGFTIGKLSTYSVAELHQIYLEHTGKKFTSKKATQLVAKSDDNYKQSHFILINALELYQLDIVAKELFKLSKILNTKQFALEILSPLMQKIGHKVMAGELSISQEHALSALIKFNIGSLLFTPDGERKKKLTKVILSTPSDEIHEFGIIIAALLCNFYSLEFMFLGTNLPQEALVDTLKATNYDMIILGTTFKSNKSQVNKLTEYMDELMESVPNKKKVVLGGPNQIDKYVLDNYKNLVPLDNFEQLDQFLNNLK